VFLTAVTFLAMEQRVNVKLGRAPTEPYEMLKLSVVMKLQDAAVYLCGVSDLEVGVSSVSERRKRFTDGREDLQDDPRSGRPLASRNADTTANVREMVT
jgi:hypothetical protein